MLEARFRAIVEDINENRKQDTNNMVTFKKKLENKAYNNGIFRNEPYTNFLNQRH